MILMMNRKTQSREKEKRVLQMDINCETTIPARLGVSKRFKIRRGSWIVYFFK